MRQTEADDPRYMGPLTSLAPPESNYVLHARPHDLYARPAFRAIVDPLFPPARLRSFRERTGVDLAEVDEAIVAHLGDGAYLIVARHERARDIVVAAGMRMQRVEVAADRPFVRRLGYLGRSLRELVAIGDDLLVLGVNAGPQVARLLRILASGRSPRGPLAGEDGVRLAAFHPRAPLRLYAPKPLGLPPDTGVGLLFARERAACVAIDPAGEHLNIWTLVLGELPPGAEANLRELFRSLGGTELGAAVGVDRALASLEVDVGEERAILNLHWPATALARGLRVLLVDELAALVDEPVFAE